MAIAGNGGREVERLDRDYRRLSALVSWVCEVRLIGMTIPTIPFPALPTILDNERLHQVVHLLGIELGSEERVSWLRGALSHDEQVRNDA